MHPDKLKSLEDWIEKAWKCTSKDFIDNNRWILWTEAAALKYPFFHNLERLREEFNTKRVMAIQEYRPIAPKSARCSKDGCSCKHGRQSKDGGKKIDLCIVQFEEELPFNIIYTEPKQKWEHNLWCFKPKPIIAMEFKYFLEKIEKDAIKKDISKLEGMLDKYGSELAYLCIVSDSQPSKKILPLENSENEEKFRVAIGTCDNDLEKWKVIPYKKL